MICKRKAIYIAPLICLCINLFAQTKTTETFELKMQTCLKDAFKNSKTTDTSPIEYFETCMHKVEFPSFCVEDINDISHCSDEMNDFYLINYWFEGCAGCINEKPFLERLSAEVPSLKIISLSRDDEDSFDDIVAKKLNWICVADHKNKSIPDNMGGYPNTFLVDKNGEISLAIMMGIQKEPAYNKVIDQLKQ